MSTSINTYTIFKTIYYKYNKTKKNCSRIKLHYKNKDNYLKSK